MRSSFFEVEGGSALHADTYKLEESKEDSLHFGEHENGGRHYAFGSGIQSADKPSIRVNDIGISFASGSTPVRIHMKNSISEAKAAVGSQGQTGPGRITRLSSRVSKTTETKPEGKDPHTAAVRARFQELMRLFTHPTRIGDGSDPFRRYEYCYAEYQRGLKNLLDEHG